MDSNKLGVKSTPTMARQLNPLGPLQRKLGSRQDWTRYLVALPLLGLCIVASHILSVAPATSFAKAQLDSRNIVWNDGWRGVPILENFYNVRWLDDIVSLANMFFMPAVYGYDASSRTQVISFLADGGVVLAIWWLESLRAGPKSLYLQYPSLLALTGQITGLGAVAPLYAFLSLISPPSQAYSLPSSTTPLIPALLLGYYIPTLLTLASPDLPDRQAFLSIWQLFPVFISLAYHTILTLSPTPKDDATIFSPLPPRSSASSTSDSDSEPDDNTQPTVPTLATLSRNLLLMRLSIGVPTLIGAVAWVATLLTTKGQIAEIFLPSALPADVLPSLSAFSAQFLRWDWVFVFGSMIVWLGVLYVREWEQVDGTGTGKGKGGYLPRGMKRGGMTVGKGVGVAVGTAAMGLVMGPGAVLGMGWWWREEVRATELERGVLKVEVQRKVNALLRANGA